MQFCDAALFLLWPYKIQGVEQANNIDTVLLLLLLLLMMMMIL
jgi:hypothetical protein